MARLSIGDKAPAFALTDQNGGTTTLDGFRGRPLLVYFYPKADTPGCTTQACSVRDADPDLLAVGMAAVGISPDTPEMIGQFAAKYLLMFPLLSDPDHTVAEAYGAWGEKSMYGKKMMGIIRSSFLIAADGTLAGVWYKVKPADTIPLALEALEKL